MKLHRYLAPVALALLSACASEYTEAEAPKDLRLDNATTHVDLRFAPGSTRLAARDATRLRAHDGLPTMDRSETEHAALERLLFVICLVLLAVIVGGMFLR